MNRILFSSQSIHWRTPESVFVELNEEFHFDCDPCPFGGSGGLNKEWGYRNFVNPPYGRSIFKWLEKGIIEFRSRKLCVFLLPARTDTKWFHFYVLPFAKEIRFIKGRLRYGGAKNNAPFPSMIIIFDGR